ncbi:MAG: hypothetical protein HQL35_15890 [Alphaproteobacteria bacterium]|nr:hypothetical protein [Alphaproteobacteria bacterium]
MKAWTALAREAVGMWRQIRAARRAYGRGVPDTGERPVYLLKSFVYRNAFGDAGEYKDPFFGVLADFLRSRLSGDVELLTVAQGFDDMTECYANMAALTGEAVVPFEVYMQVWDIPAALFKIAAGLSARPLRVPQGLEILGAPVDGLIREHLASGGWKMPLQHHLYGPAARRIAGRHRLRACAMTYEANPWEKCFVDGLRRAGMTGPVIGYQHAVTPPAAAGVFTDHGGWADAPLPDRVVTTGPATAAMLRDFGAVPAERLRAGCALRYGYLHAMTPFARRQGEGATVLLALEGVVPAADLLAYALDQAAVHPHLWIRVRTHPVLSFEALLKLAGRTPADVPANIELSPGGPVRDDVRDCDAVLYWGTAVSAEAVLMGRPVIHYNRAALLSFDPLFALTDFKWTLGPGESLGKAMAEIQSLADDAYAAAQDKACAYVKNYFAPVTDEALAVFLPDDGDGAVQ